MLEWNGGGGAVTATATATETSARSAAPVDALVAKDIDGLVDDRPTRAGRNHDVVDDGTDRFAIGIQNHLDIDFFADFDVVVCHGRSLIVSPVGQVPHRESQSMHGRPTGCPFRPTSIGL